MQMSLQPPSVAGRRRTSGDKIGPARNRTASDGGATVGSGDS